MRPMDIAIKVIEVFGWLFALCVFAYVWVYGFISDLISFLVQHIK